MRLHRRLTRPALSYSVMDGIYVRPQPPSDVLLPDLNWDDLVAHLPKDLLHKSCLPTSPGQLVITNQLRTVGLLPVTRTVARKESSFWAPFVIDTGGPSTFFCLKTQEKLELSTADHVSVCGKRILLSTSSNHFDDINLLGTDVLRG